MDSTATALAPTSIPDDWASRINQEHREALQLAGQGLLRAIEVGRMLDNVKRFLPHGQYVSWVKSNCEFKYRTAADYVRLFHNRAEIEAKLRTSAHLSVNRALKLIADPKPQPAAVEPEQPEAPAAPEPEQQLAAWAKVIDTAPIDKAGKPKITAKHVESVVNDMAAVGNCPRGGDHEFDDEACTKCLEPVDSAADDDDDLDHHKASMAEWNTAIERWARSVPQLIKSLPEGAWLDQNRVEIITSQLKAAANTARAVKGHDLCPKCEGKGKGCKKCRQTGWLNKVDFESAATK